MDLNLAKTQWARGPHDRPADTTETAIRQAIAAERGRQRRGSQDEHSDEEKIVVSMNNKQAMEFFQFVKDSSKHHTRTKPSVKPSTKNSPKGPKGLEGLTRYAIWATPFGLRNLGYVVWATQSGLCNLGYTIWATQAGLRNQGYAYRSYRRSSSLLG